MDSSYYQKFLSRVKNVKKYMGLSCGWRGWDLHKGVQSDSAWDATSQEQVCHLNLQEYSRTTVV